ncbi:MAG: ABC transporter ATP-binding protein [Fidelibacterota bacterium]
MGGDNSEIVVTIDLEKIYDEKVVPVHALRGVDLTVRKGEFMAIAGPSGSGKTTLLNLIGGLDIPSRGRVLLGGKDISTLNSSELADFRLRNIGFIFQAYNLIPVLTAEENVEFVMMLQGVDHAERRRRVEEILRNFDIIEYAKHRPGELSGGQQQRVAVARAIVSEPKIVLADEPTANLDSVTGASVMNMMEELNVKKEITFVFSTHDKMVMDRARRLVILRDGKIVEDKTINRSV